LAPSDYCLFPDLNKYLKWRKFLSIKEATLAAEADGLFAAKLKEFLAWVI
jgi:hypothetical protein